MEDIHKSILRKFLHKAMEEITDPSMVCEHLPFTEADKEKIKCTQRQEGPTKAVQELILRLTKRGKDAFWQFLEALKHPHIKCDHLACEIEKELQQRLGFVDRSSVSSSGSLPSQSSVEESQDSLSLSTKPPELPSYDLVSRGPWTFADDKARNSPSSFKGAIASPPPDYYDVSPIPSIAPTNGNHMTKPKKIPLPHQASDDDSMSACHNHSPPRGKLSFEPESLLKDIPSTLKDKIVQILNIPDALCNNWRRLAGKMGLSTSDVETLESSRNGKMSGLFTCMVQRNFTVQNLLDLLAECERNDVIHEIQEAGLSYGNEGTAACAVETEQEATENESPASSQQESVSDSKDSEMLTHPSEATENAEEQEFIASESLHEMQNIGHDADVFSDDIQRSSLIIECLAYKNLSKLDGLEGEVKKLKKMMLSLDYQIKSLTKRDVTGAKLNRMVDQFIEDYGSDICFVYMVGHTVQINGESYLVPTDISPDSTRADIKCFSLNINKLVQRLDVSRIVIVDGAHHNEATFSSTAVLPGLCPVPPPPNSVIAFPCAPGTVTRSPTERTLYISALCTVLDENPNILLSTMFARIREEMKDKCRSPPVEFSLLTSLLPFSLNASSSSESDGAASVGLRVPNSSTAKHALIFSNSTKQHYTHVARDTEHLRMALLKLGWDVKSYCDKTSTEMCDKLRSDISELSIPDSLTTVMVFFIGSAKQAGEDNQLVCIDGPESSVSTQWIVDLMCEYLSGPKILIVDDLQTTEEGLEKMTAPQECLISLPHARRTSKKCVDQSYTLLFAQLMSANSGRSIEAVVRWASRNQHHVTSNLFYA